MQSLWDRSEAPFQESTHLEPSFAARRSPHYVTCYPLPVWRQILTCEICDEHLEMEDRLSKRAKRASRAKFDRALAEVPDVGPENRDKTS